jgi:aspartyl/asparaginyl-tRNA synthetase
MERNYVEEVFKKQAGEKVCLKGWVYDARDLKKVLSRDI